MAGKVFALEVSGIRAGGTGPLVTALGRGTPMEAACPQPTGVSGAGAFPV